MRRFEYWMELVKLRFEQHSVPALDSGTVPVTTAESESAIQRPLLVMVPPDGVHVSTGLSKPATAAANSCCLPACNGMV